MEWKPGRGARSDTGQSERPVLDHARLRTAKRAMKRPNPKAPPDAPAPKGEDSGHGSGDGRRPGPGTGAAPRAENLLPGANGRSSKPGDTGAAGVRPEACRIVCAGSSRRTGAAEAGVPTVGASARGRDPVAKDPSTTVWPATGATPEA